VKNLPINPECSDILQILSRGGSGPCNDPNI